MSRRCLSSWVPVVLLVVLVAAGCGGGGTPKLMVTTTSLPGGTVGVPYTPSLTATGGTPPYTWSQASGGTMPPGVSISNLGVFDGTPKTSGNYGPYVFTVTDSNSLTASSVGLSITVTTTSLTVNTSSLPAGTAGVPYSVTLLASGGSLPYTWTVTSGGALPPGLGPLTTGGALAGTPTTAGTYGPYVFTVTDASNATAVSGSLSFTINSAGAAACPPAGNEAALPGGIPYAFLVKGTDASGNPIDIAGSFTPDGKGGITAGTADYNGFTNGPSQLQVNLSNSMYSVGANGQGCLYLAFSGPASDAASQKRAELKQPLQTAKIGRAKSSVSPQLTVIVPSVLFSFNLGAFDGTLYHSGRLIETDSSTASGAITSGFLHVQDPTAFAISSLQSNYAFGLDGWTSSVSGYLRTALAGSFTNTSGALSASHADLNTGGTPSGELGEPTIPGSGTLNANLDSTTGRGTGSYTIPMTVGSLTFDFAFYILNASDLAIVSTDSPASVGSAPLLAGRVLASNASYSSGPLNGYYLLQAKGYVANGSASGNQVEIGTLNAASSGTVPVAAVYSNSAGSYTVSNYTNASYSVESKSGRALFSGLSATPPIVYLTSTGNNDDGIFGFLVGTDAAASGGELVLQSATAPSFGAGSVSGNFVGGNDEDLDGLNGAYLGLFNFSGTGNFTVTSQVVGKVSVVPVTGPITVNADGSGNLNNGSLALVTNGTQIFAVPETGDPQLFVISAVQ